MSDQTKELKENSSGTSVGGGEDRDAPDLAHRILRKAETALLSRTSRIAVVVERVTDDHNYSAIIRTVEALGVQHLWVISPKTSFKKLGEAVSHTPTSDGADGDEENTHPEKVDQLKVLRNNGGAVVRQQCVSAADRAARKEHHTFAQRATEWVQVREFDTVDECVARCRADGRELWATDLGQGAECLTKEGLGGGSLNPSTSSPKDSSPPQPEESKCTPQQQHQNEKSLFRLPRLAIVFGTESVGCTQAMLTAADRRVYLPLRGFADSLNLSVAAALCLQQLFHLDPTVIGDMATAERQALRREWYTKLVRQRIMTPSQKRKRKMLATKVAEIELLEAKQHVAKLNTPEEAKLKKVAEYRASLQEMDNTAQAKAEETVAPFLAAAEMSEEDNSNNIDGVAPIAPLSDMRRADAHRVCYVGRRTKAANKEAWAGMAAVGGFDHQGNDSSSGQDLTSPSSAKAP